MITHQKYVSPTSDAKCQAESLDYPTHTSLWVQLMDLNLLFKLKHNSCSDTIFQFLQYQAYQWIIQHPIQTLLGIFAIYPYINKSNLICRLDSTSLADIMEL